MNKVIMMGRLTRNPDVRYSQSSPPVCVARYTLAVNRKFKRQGEPDADFVNCVALGKNGEFAEKYLKQGTKIVVCGRIQTGSYEKDGRKVYTTEVVVEEHDFAESKKYAEEAQQQKADDKAQQQNSDGFMKIPEGLEEELPFT